MTIAQVFEYEKGEGAKSVFLHWYYRDQKAQYQYG